MSYQHPTGQGTRDTKTTDIKIDIDNQDEDVLEEITNMESKFYQEGYQAGYDHGQLHGLFEGRELGKEKAWELWEEIGYYEGFTRTYVNYLEGLRASFVGGGKGGGMRRKDDRALNHAQVLLSLISTFPTINPSQPPSHNIPSSITSETPITDDQPKRFGELNYNINHGKTLNPDEVVFFYTNPPNADTFTYVGMMFPSDGNKVESIVFNELMDLVRLKGNDGLENGRKELQVDNARYLKFAQPRIITSDGFKNGGKTMDEIFRVWFQEELQYSSSSSSEETQNDSTRPNHDNAETGTSEIDLSTLTSNIRARYKLLCSSLNTKPRLQNAQFVEAIPGSGAGAGAGAASGQGGVVEGIEGPIKGVDTRQLRF